MDRTSHPNNYSRTVKYIALILALSWTFAVVLSFLGGWVQTSKSKNKLLVATAKEQFDRDLLYRSWIVMHGGVYVPITEQTPPNPYLQDVPERDITTPSGKKLTLMNPAYMSRQVFELGSTEADNYGHITSLNPIRPENVPDAWERKALESFDSGVTDYFSIDTIDNREFMRYMKPLVVTQGCMSCHAKQGYKVGDIRGGISESVPADKYDAHFRSTMIMMGSGFGILWILGILGLILGMNRILGLLKNREKSSDALSQAQVELQNHRDLMTNLASLIPGVIYQYKLNPDGSSAFPYSSVGMNMIYEVSPEEVQEDATPVFGRLHPEDYQMVADAIEESATTLETFYCEFRVQLPEQGVRWRWSQAQPEQTEDGGVLWHGIIIDVTDRKLAELEKDKLQEQLQQAQKMESVGRLAGGVAHDFNNMLGVILGHADFAKEMVQPGSDLRESLDEIEKAAKRSASLTQQLLAFARKQTITPRVLDLNDVLDSMLGMLRRLIGEFITVELRPEPTLSAVRVDPSQIDQILANLCVNARDAINGNGTIVINTANCTLDEEYCESRTGLTPGDYVLLSVRDDGEGIPPPEYENAV